VNARAIVTVVLLGATCSALYLLRSHNSDTAVVADTSVPAAEARDNAQTNPRITLATDLSADSASSDAPLGPVPEAEPPVLFEHQVPPTPIAQALEDLQLPPMPELLEAERAFAAERADSLWADATEGYILGEIARTTGLQLVTLQVECRTSMCRLHLVERQSQDAEPRILFPSVRGAPARNAQLGPFVNLVAGLDLDPRWVASVVDGNGTPTSLAYLARRGSAGTR
jgi:hypothetical protein